MSIFPVFSASSFLVVVRWL